MIQWFVHYYLRSFYKSDADLNIFLNKHLLSFCLFTCSNHFNRSYINSNSIFYNCGEETCSGVISNINVCLAPQRTPVVLFLWLAPTVFVSLRKEDLSPGTGPQRSREHTFLFIKTSLHTPVLTVLSVKAENWEAVVVGRKKTSRDEAADQSWLPTELTLFVHIKSFLNMESGEQPAFLSALLWMTLPRPCTWPSPQTIPASKPTLLLTYKTEPQTSAHVQHPQNGIGENKNTRVQHHPTPHHTHTKAFPWGSLQGNDNNNSSPKYTQHPGPGKTKWSAPPVRLIHCPCFNQMVPSHRSPSVAGRWTSWVGWRPLSSSAWRWSGRGQPGMWAGSPSSSAGLCRPARSPGKAGRSREPAALSYSNMCFRTEGGSNTQNTCWERVNQKLWYYLRSAVESCRKMPQCSLFVLIY